MSLLLSVRGATFARVLALYRTQLMLAHLYYTLRSYTARIVMSAKSSYGSVADRLCSQPRCSQHVRRSRRSVAPSQTTSRTRYGSLPWAFALGKPPGGESPEPRHLVRLPRHSWTSRSTTRSFAQPSRTCTSLQLVRFA